MTLARAIRVLRERHRYIDDQLRRKTPLVADVVGTRARIERAAIETLIAAADRDP